MKCIGAFPLLGKNMTVTACQAHRNFPCELRAFYRGAMLYESVVLVGKFLRWWVLLFG